MRVILISALVGLVSCASSEGREQGAGTTPAAAPSTAPQRTPERATPRASGRATTFDAEWTDAARKRTVPVKVFVPGGVGEPAPLLIFSHGGGGGRDGFDAYADAFVRAGYVVVVPQHKGSDKRTLLTGGLKGSIEDPEQLTDRPLDISFVIDRALAGDARARIDAGRIAVMGHSFGAYTAMAVGGMTVDLPGQADRSFRDERVACVVALSPQGTGQMGISSNAWEGVSCPVLMITGTKDEGYGPGQDAAWRLQAFGSLDARTDAPPTYLAIVKDATHMDFAGRESRRDGRRASPARRAAVRAVQTLGVDMLDAWLRGDSAARARLAAGEFASKPGAATTMDSNGATTE